MRKAIFLPLSNGHTAPVLGDRLFPSRLVRFSSLVYIFLFIYLLKYNEEPCFNLQTQPLYFAFSTLPECTRCLEEFLEVVPFFTALGSARNNAY